MDFSGFTIFQAKLSVDVKMNDAVKDREMQKKSKNTKPFKKVVLSKSKPVQSKNKTIDGQIVAMNEFGDGEIHGFKKTIKVVRTVPGDQVRVQIPDNDKQFVYGSLLSLLKPSEKRINPNCGAFIDGCGGCQWLHFDYKEQLKWKTKILREMLKQRCSVPIRVNEIIPMSDPFAYRNKLSLRNVNGRFVNMQDFDEKIVAPLKCQVETKPNQQAREILMPQAVPRDLLQVHVRSTEDGLVGMHLFVSAISPQIREFSSAVSSKIKGLVGIGAQIKEKYELLWGRNFLEYNKDGLTYNIPLNGFFQTNYEQAGLLCDLALKQLSCCKSDSVLDLYCGCGFFTLPIAKKAKNILGIENNAASTANAAANAKLNKIDNVKFHTADVASGLRGLKKGEWQLVLLDPPRAGCDENAIRELIRIAPVRIVYVSCSPASLARDLKLLLAASYTVSYCQPIDMFPHTAHMETVVTLTRRQG
jgi:23S rRNA (uracil1939-C5)-methyltransferase